MKPKSLKILTAILAFIFFAIPYILEITDWNTGNSVFYAVTFIPVWIYNYFYTLTPLKHILPFVGLLLFSVLLWVCLYRVAAEINDIFLDIYLNKKRFRKDSDDL